MDKTKNNAHYVCTGGCNGVSSDPDATCQAAECADYGQPLKACDCTDGTHHNEEK